MDNNSILNGILLAQRDIATQLKIQNENMKYLIKELRDINNKLG